MSKAIAARVAALEERAAARSLGLRRAPEPPWGWELDNAHSVVARGSLDDIDRWLTNAENGDRR
ncbi:hypothetical protein [Nocardia neocaledoniensis]|uniref:hypothetical protein n=1 Tax=Nocardia neocaledoniensis TaxID=236511 RepID=UPI0024581ECB|nr:hypothetical protein [Nocardia neocaledoniensis]